MTHQILSPLLTIIVALLVIWVIFYAIAIMFQQQDAFSSWSKKNLKAFFNWLWKHYRQFFIGFIAGIVSLAAYLHYLCHLI